MRTHSSLRWRTFCALCLSLLPFSLLSQNPSTRVFEDWNTTSGTQNTFHRSVLRTEPGTTNYFLAGATLNAGGNYDLLIVKYNTAGSVIWSQQVNGNGNGDDYAADLQIDNSGNVIVTGTTFESSADSFNVITVMYDSGGNQQWIATYNGSGSGNDGATSIYVDNASGEIYVAGAEWQGTSTLYDVMLIKYDASGSQQWAATYDNANLVDVAVRVRQNTGTGNIEVGGATQTTLTNRKYLVAEFDPSSGSLVNAYTSTSSSLGIENLTDLKTDNDGNIFVTGSVMGTSTGMDIRTLMLDTNLSIVWSATYSGALNDEGNALDLDAAGNVLVTGYTTSSTQGRNFITIKYDSAGSQLWATTFNGAMNGDDSATCIVVHPTDTNKIYVSGFSYYNGTKDYWTVKYDGLGNQKWDIGFNHVEDEDDRATAIALDTLGNVIVTGQNKLIDGTFEFTTVKYVEKNLTYPEDTITTISSVVFTKNNGQVVDTGGNQRPEIKYYTISTSPRVYFMDTTISYLYARIDTSTSNNDSIVRVDQKFVGANADLKIYSADEKQEYYNFYLGHIPEGRTHVKNYGTLVTFNVWDSVDVLYSGNARGLKTYYVCKPLGGGGSASFINLEYFGADSVKIGVSGELLIYSPLGILIQPKASAWQLDTNGNYQPLGWQPSYNLVATNEIKFTSFGSYNASLPLIIAVDWGDSFYPTFVTDNLLWSTYMGGSDDDLLNSVSVNASNWAFDGGVTMSLNFINASGGYQGQNGGSEDGIIGMYNSGMWLWRTYYGGVASDRIFSVSANGGTNTVYFTGGTYSADFPVGGPPGTFQNYSTTTNGPSDAFIGKLDGSGALSFATCYGSSTGNETGTIIKATNQFNSFYVAGYGADGSTPLTSETGASNLTVGDAFILKYNPTTFVREWATLYGGTPNSTNHTSIMDLELGANSTNYIVITGNTGTSDLPSPTNSAAGGLNDAFIASFTSGDVLNWSTYYGGTQSGKSDNSTGVVVNSMGEIFIAGWTTSNDLPTPNPNGGWNDNSFAGGTLRGDAFVAQFSSSGNLIWGTYLGGTADEDAYDLAVDYMDNIYVVGASRSSSFPGWPFLTNPAGVWAHPLHGPTNAFIVQFNRWQGLGWGTYFGGEFIDEANSIHIYKDPSSSTSYLYLAGETCSSANPGYTYPFPVVHTGAFSSASLQNSGLNFNNYSTWTYRDGFIAAFDLSAAITGIENPRDSSANFSIFPTPNSGCFSIEVPTQPNEKFTIVIYDVLGQIVYSEKVVATSLTFRKQIHLEMESSGLYSVQIQSEHHVSTQQTIIQH
ncbi:MAG: hypothetical protein RL007_322 [Bacteroidota bacterium]|jgi:hypothetical protein